MADLFGTMVTNLQNMGFFQYLFPFLLAFAVLYGALQWIFKEEGLGGRRVHALIAIVISFFVMLYSAANPWMYLFIVILLALAGVNLHTIIAGEQRWIRWVFILVIAFIVLAALLGWGVMAQFIPTWLSYNDLWTVILLILILALVFWFVGGEEKKAEGGGEAAKPTG
jgi:hypothetical protein